jgi:ribosome-associated translation inhibitor RaiA
VVIDSAVSREELEQLVAAYRRALTMHRRSRPGSRARRRWVRESERVAEHFESALDAAVADEELRKSWREHLHNRGPEPVEPHSTRPVLFRGRSDAGSRIEIRPGPKGDIRAGPEGDLDVRVDGVEVERLDRADELLTMTAGLTLRLDVDEFTETFEASAEALEALSETIALGEPAPSAFAAELMADGLLDRSLGLTPRGRRALAGAGPGHATRRPGLEAPIEITARGTVSRGARRRLHAELAELARVAPRPVLFARGELVHEDDPALERPAIAKAKVGMSGRVVRAHVAAPDSTQAIRLVVDRLQRLLRDVGDRDEAGRRAPRGGEPLGELSAVRPERRSLPPADRELVGRKSFALERMTPSEATSEMELLDHDFYLFTNVETGAENVVYRRADGATGLDEHGPVLGVAEALEALDAVEAPFFFFVERESGRGAVVYRRYDGHDGLITAA